MMFTTAPPCVCVTTLADSARRPFDGNRLAALLGQWPRDAETALQAVSADLGIDIKPGRSEEELAVLRAHRGGPISEQLARKISQALECEASAGRGDVTLLEAWRRARRIRTRWCTSTANRA